MNKNKFSVKINSEDISLLELLVNTTLDFVCLKTKVYIAVTTMVNVILQREIIMSTLLSYELSFSHLIEHIIQTLIEVFQIEQNDRPPCLHTNLDLINVPTHLNTHT